MKIESPILAASLSSLESIIRPALPLGRDESPNKNKPHRNNNKKSIKMAKLNNRTALKWGHFGVAPPLPPCTWSCPSPPPGPRSSHPARRHPACTPRPGPVRGQECPQYVCVPIKPHTELRGKDMGCMGPPYLPAEPCGLPLEVLVAPIKQNPGDVCICGGYLAPPVFLG